MNLLNGVKEEDRTPIIENLPPVVFLDSGQGCEKASANSYYNEYEIQVVVQLVSMLTLASVEPSQIGIIALCELKYLINNKD